jgi:hypothetical protein
MFETLFGSEMPLAARFFIAFLVVLALIGATAWLVRRFGANRLGGVGARGRQPRLAVIDAATVDGRRRLVVIEPNIVRAVGSREVTREPTRTEPSTRTAPGAENSWPLQPISEPAPVAPARQYRAPGSDEPWHAPEPGARPRPADSLTGLAAELSTRLNPDMAPPVRNEPPPRVVPAPAVTPEPAAAPQTDHNLAEMAQQLEAALRRPPEGRPPVTDPLAVPAAAPGRAPARDYKLRVDPKFDSKFETKIEAKPEPKFEPKFDAKPEQKPDAPPTPGKNLYDNLEEEMASLLGRPSGKT